MAKDIKRYDLLISCPGDVIEAVEIVKEVVEEFNQHFSDTLGILIRSRHWSHSAYSESGGSPQTLLNKQLVDDADLAVAIFKNRFGTPTDNYGSGTEEEIEKMLAEGKQVFMFFDESPVKPSDIDRNEYDRVQQFKEKYSGKGIYWTYSSDSEFKNIFRAHITQYFMSLSKNDLSEEQSNLKIRSCKSGKLEDHVYLSCFDMGGFISSKELIIQIRDAIKHISEMKIIKSSLPVQSALGIFVGKKVELEKGTINIIKSVAEKLEIIIPDVFFDVGNLMESPMLSNLPFGGRALEGTKEEKDKYYAIMDLKDLIYQASDHKQIEDCYGNLYGIELILCNDGTRFDEDIDIEIEMPRDRFVFVEDLPVPSQKINLGDDWSFADVFEISATKDFISYNDTKKPLSGFAPSRYTSVNPIMGRDYEDEYRDTLREIFNYDFFTDNDNVVIKVHFDYIKQHQCAAFPTWIFINKPEEGISARYSITTKFNKNVIEGQIEIRPGKE